MLFGGKKLPEMMRGLGQGVREFKKGMNEVKEENLKEDTVPDTSTDKSSSKQDSETSDEIESK